MTLTFGVFVTALKTTHYNFQIAGALETWEIKKEITAEAYTEIDLIRLEV